MEIVQLMTKRMGSQDLIKRREEFRNCLELAGWLLFDEDRSFFVAQGFRNMRGMDTARVWLGGQKTNHCGSL